MVAAAAALAGVALALPAQALLIADVRDSRSGAICNATDTLTPGILTLLASSCNNSNFASISGTIIGSPSLTTPDLNTNQLSATTSNLAAPFPDTLTITVVQSGLSFAGGPASVALGVNALTGANSVASLTAQAPIGTTLLSQSFSGIGHPTPTDVTLGALTSDAAVFQLTATGPNQTQATSIVIAAEAAPATPEPGSLVLLGSALAGFGGVGVGWRARRRRRGDDARPGAVSGGAGRGGC